MLVYINNGVVLCAERHRLTHALWCAGKVVDRHWYNKNKHIFPASRWEVYEPEKQFDSYTIYG